MHEYYRGFEMHSKQKFISYNSNNYKYKRYIIWRFKTEYATELINPNE